MSDAVARLYRRLMMLVGRGRIKVVDDTQTVQFLQIQLGSDEIRDKTPRLAEYGFTSSPPPGSDGVAVFLTGDRSDGIVIATGNQQFRPTGLQPGDSAMHNNTGNIIKITASGIQIIGNVTVTGTITATGEITAKSTHTVSNHTHGGVQTGSGNTGLPTG